MENCEKAKTENCIGECSFYQYCKNPVKFTACEITMLAVIVLIDAFILSLFFII